MPGSATAIFFGGVVPRRLRHAAGGPGRLRSGVRRAGRLTCRVSPGRPGMRSTCAACAAATRLPSRSRPRSGRRERAGGWTLNLEREDVCPVVTLPVDGGFEDFLATLGGKERHEVRRKIRRAEASGRSGLARSADPLADLPAFIELHQKRWGDEGLFPDDPGWRGQPAVLPAPVRAARRRRTAGPVVPARRRPSDRGGRPPRGRTVAALLQRGHGPCRPGPEPRRADGRGVRRGGPRRRLPPDGLPARRRVRTSTSGAPSTSRSSASWSAGAWSDGRADGRRSVPRAGRLAGRRRRAGAGSSRSWRQVRTAAPRSTSSR